jgi:hypothetical protein
MIADFGLQIENLRLLSRNGRLSGRSLPLRQAQGSKTAALRMTTVVEATGSSGFQSAI